MWVFCLCDTVATHECMNVYLDSSNLLNIKVIGQRSRLHGSLVHFCLHDTRRQYLALCEGFTCSCILL